MINNFNAEKRENKMLWALCLIACIAGLYYFLRPILVMIIMPDVILPENAFLAWWVLPTSIVNVVNWIFLYAHTKSLLNTVSFEIDGERIVCSIEGFLSMNPTSEKINKMIHVTHDGINVFPEMNNSFSRTNAINYTFKTESGRNVYVHMEKVMSNSPTIDVNIDDEFVISKNMLIKNRLAAVA